jgi:adenylate cyclase
MSSQDVKRKLTAILSADVKGYSRLMGKDEAGTLQTLTTYKETMAAFITQHHGRVVDAPGDNLLAEFASVVDALQCAVEIQEELKDRNSKLPLPRHMEFRMGINLGDVIEEEDKIYGDGVNIAARLESLSEPGRICISGSVHDQVKDKLPLRYEYLGKQTVKNIAEPIRAYRVLTEPASRISTWKRRGLSYWKRVHPAVKILIALIALANGLWPLYTHFVSRPHEVASKEKMALPLPDKPSLAVLPFVNMSDDPKQEYFTDGITESLITALSKVPGLFVIAQDSTFTYKGKAVKVKQVSEELGVQYVLEGSVQRSTDRIRITAQLVDALTGHHLWAESYDRDMKDIFALQDEITIKILTAARVKLMEGEQALGYGKYYGGKQGLACYLKIMEGNDLVFRRNIKDTNLARGIAEEVLAMCPEVPMAYLLMANVHSVDERLGSTPRESVEKGIQMVQKALALDDTLAEAHGLLGHLYTQKREYEKGIAEGERAVALNPSGATVLANYAATLFYAGRPEEAIQLFQKAIRLNPFIPKGLY